MTNDCMKVSHPELKRREEKRKIENKHNQNNIAKQF